MKAFRIKELNHFISRLLKSDAFDCFLLSEGTVVTYNIFVIDGHMVKEFFAGDVADGGEMPPYDFSCWADMRPLCFDLIKGKRTPVSFKFVLHLKPELVAEILKKEGSSVSPSDIKALVLNIKYDGSELTCITATAFHSFLPDKAPDRLWDQFIQSFLDAKGISFEELS